MGHPGTSWYPERDYMSTAWGMTLKHTRTREHTRSHLKSRDEDIKEAELKIQQQPLPSLRVVGPRLLKMLLQNYESQDAFHQCTLDTG